MKEIVFIVYSVVHFGTTTQERYYLVTDQDNHACFEPINCADVNYYVNAGAKIDTQVVYTKPVVSIK